MKSIGIIVSILSILLLIGLVYKYTNNNISYNNNTMENIEYKNAYFAGGCFWCMEGIFESQDGVKEAIAGYAGGSAEDATYPLVSSGNTQHREAVQIIYNPEKINFKTLIDLYWTQIDPTDEGGQFADRGSQYTTAIFYSDEKEKNIALHARDELSESEKFDKPIVVKIEPFTTFFPAEEYHQDYYKKSSLKYNIYKKGSGRADFIEKNSERDQADLKERLTPLQYEVTQEGGTEKAFNNTYWDNKEKGIYVDIVDGTPLFSSNDKFVSGTGWPSFTQPIDDGNIRLKEDVKFFMKRTEVKSKYADSHLGHVFDDGPEDTGGKRYCINSAALRFIPSYALKDEGYEEYVEQFQ